MVRCWLALLGRAVLGGGDLECRGEARSPDRGAEDEDFPPLANTAMVPVLSVTCLPAEVRGGGFATEPASRVAGETPLRFVLTYEATIRHTTHVDAVHVWCT